MGKRISLLVTVAVFACVCDVVHTIRWLSLHHSNLQWNSSRISESPSGRGIRSGNRSPCSVARRKYGLAKPQARLCRASTDTMPYVQQAALLAVETCQKVFETRRWNCSSTTMAPYLTPDLLRATREQAYVYAVSSAALTYAMARACASGSLHQCTCAGRPGESPKGDFKWGGCGDNVKFGKNFAKRFLDDAERRHERISREGKKKELVDEKMKRFKGQFAEVNLHNNRVGRRVLMESITTQCKCHGVSGSCSIRTCWRALPHMSEIGYSLLKRYTNAKDVSKIGFQEAYSSKFNTQNELVYITRSPDYCTKDEKMGSFGTVGRKCNVTSNGTDSCRQLCCGRGYQTVVEEKIERCQCKYYYCCYVKCKICRTYTKRFQCS